MTSKKPKIQRKARYAAPLHIRRKFVSAHLSKELRASLGTRSIPLRKGDKVVVLRGKYAGQTSKVSSIDLKSCVVYLEDIKRRTARGTEVHVPFHASNLVATDIVMEDPKRKEMIERKKSKGKIEKGKVEKGKIEKETKKV